MVVTQCDAGMRMAAAGGRPPFPITLHLDDTLAALQRCSAPLVVTYGLEPVVGHIAGTVCRAGGRALVIERNAAAGRRVHRKLLQAGLLDSCIVYAWDVEMWATQAWLQRIENWLDDAPVSHVLLDDGLGLLTLSQLDLMLPSLQTGDALIACIRTEVAPHWPLLGRRMRP